MHIAAQATAVASDASQYLSGIELGIWFQRLLLHDVPLAQFDYWQGLSFFGNSQGLRTPLPAYKARIQADEKNNRQNHKPYSTQENSKYGQADAIRDFFSRGISGGHFSNYFGRMLSEWSEIYSRCSYWFPHATVRKARLTIPAFRMFLNSEFSGAVWAKHNGSCVSRVCSWVNGVPKKTVGAVFCAMSECPQMAGCGCRQWPMQTMISSVK